MKTIKKINIVALLLAIVACFSACEKDGDKILLGGLESSELIATQTAVVLTQGDAANMALALAWTDNTLVVNNPGMDAPKVLSTSILVSTTSDFSENVIESKETGLSKSYTTLELNALVKNLGLLPDVSTPVYFRLKGSIGANIAPVYSNTVTVDITAYEIDMTIGFILDSKMERTNMLLSSPMSNGIYSGFMGVGGWYNFYMEEGNNDIWGNDAPSGNPFLLTAENDADKRWNLWFPGTTGCYFTTMNTISKQWTAVLLPSLTVSGDIQAEMTFDRPNIKWTVPVTANAAASFNIKLNSAAKQYDYTTDTDDAAAKDTPLAFAPDGSTIVFAAQAENITVSVPTAGDYTLVVDFSNPNAWTCTIEAGSQEPEPIIENIYLPGIDDAISGSWTFDNYLKLYNEAELDYAGVFNVNSNYGYSMHIEKDNWDDKYTMVEGGDAYAGALEFKGENNITPPPAGLYLIEASLSEFAYNATAIGSEIYVLGLHDAWNFETALSATAVVGEYAGDVTINSASEWGFAIHIVNDDWDKKFGGADGKLYYRGQNITDDTSLQAGTYHITVNLIKETYSIQPK